MTKFEHWKHLWATWDLRLVVLGSLFLQILLIFSAPLRKRVSRVWISIPIWLAYLLADMATTFAVGLISKSQGQTDKFGPFAYPDLLAFWAPFLLVHLGGPDTITAFALEDNELWLRHLLGLVFQCGAVIYAFFQSFPYKTLWPPTVLMFFAGLIKYAERTRALYLASSRRFKESLLTEPDPGPNYAKLMDEYTSKIEARLPTKIEMIPEPSRANRIGNKEDWLRNNTRDFFLKRTSRDAFKVVEVELNFFYEVLYTKATVVQKEIGYIFRFLSFSLNCAAIALFKYYVKKKEFAMIDIGISYTLLLGAIALDLVAFTMVLYSDWTAVTLTSYEHPNWFIRILKRLLRVNRVRWPKEAGKESRCFLFEKIMQIVRLRWSESLSKFNLINYCLHPRSKWWETTIDFFGLTNMLDGMKYVKTEDFNDDLRDLIFEELKMKSELADDLETAKEIFSARGDWILRFESCTDLLRWVNEVDFDESLIMWHIATELCYSTNEGSKCTNDRNTNAGNPSVAHEKNFRELSKLLSDYMLYLLILQATMLSTVAGIGQIRFRDTSAEAKKFFLGRKIRKSGVGSNCCLKIFSFWKCFYGDELEKGQENELQKRACESILAVNTAVEPVAVKGDRSKSILFDACMLAKDMKKLESKRMWEIVSKVWVELLSYAASHCRANTHAAQLSKGGQLLTLVWLLMAHLGLGNQFQISEGHARAKLIVRK
ncbi:hypothetical protein Vadar_021333 [Vaccinium darrowii]|uniref:Uncharacterized protein n=1 Tax=Vaccinium darrowii TaxID=229202 RepID=A0ACB7XB99_9ERIC|nr:hypothetical protein Vadar_021333 [Vaccinium darrowii]